MVTDYKEYMKYFVNSNRFKGKSSILFKAFYVFLVILLMVGICSANQMTNFNMNRKLFISEMNTVSFSTQQLIKQRKSASKDSIGFFHTVLFNLKNNVYHMAKDPTFYAVIGGLAIAPVLLKSEKPKLSESWGGKDDADKFFEYGNITGSIIFPIIIPGVALSIGKLGNSSKLLSLGSDLICAQAINAFLTIFLKRIVDRKRPDGSSFSFPSGHTSASFTTAGMIWYHLGPKWGVPTELGATYVGLSRLQENKHYLSDVIAGAILGSFVSSEIAHYRHKKHYPHIKPIFKANATGLELGFSF